MINITSNNLIDRDGEIIGQIIDNIAWLKSKQAPRILGQIRSAAGMDNLSFEMLESPTISTPEVVDIPPVLKPVAVCDDAAAGTPSYDLTGFGTIGSPYFQRCFVNHYGSKAYSKFIESNPI